MQVSSTGKPVTAAIDRRELSAALRAQVFGVKSGEVRGSRASTLYGAMIETAFADTVVSLVALTDGSVSVYVSDGNGCIGCGAHADVRAAGAELLVAAGDLVAVSAPTQDLTVPAPGSVRIFLLTDAGLKSLQMSQADACRTDSSFGTTYAAGLHLIETIKRTGAGRSLQAEIDAISNVDRSTHRNEIVGEITNETEPCCLSVGNAVRRLRS